MSTRLVLGSLLISLAGLCGISCQNNNSGNSAPALSKEQLKGSWQYSSIMDPNGAEHPAHTNGREVFQLQISDGDITYVFSDELGVKQKFSKAYKIDGRHLVIGQNQGDGVTFPSYEVVSVNANKLVLSNPADTAVTKAKLVFNRIDDKELATNKAWAIIAQSIDVKLEYKGAISSEMNKVVAFRDSHTDKILSCQSYGGGFKILYAEFGTNSKNAMSFSTDKDSSILFTIPGLKFDLSKSDETFNPKITGGSLGPAYSIINAASKKTYYGGAGTTCSYNITRTGRSVTVTGDCSGSNTYSSSDSNAKVNVSALCVLEIN